MSSVHGCSNVAYIDIVEHVEHTFKLEPQTFPLSAGNWNSLSQGNHAFGMSKWVRLFGNKKMFVPNTTELPIIIIDRRCIGSLFAMGILPGSQDLATSHHLWCCQSESLPELMLSSLLRTAFAQAEAEGFSKRETMVQRRWPWSSFTWFSLIFPKVRILRLMINRVCLVYFPDRSELLKGFPIKTQLQSTPQGTSQKRWKPIPSNLSTSC